MAVSISAFSAQTIFKSVHADVVIISRMMQKHVQVRFELVY